MTLRMRPDHPFRRSGPDHPAAKLGERERHALMGRRAAGEAVKRLAHQYGVSEATVRRICQ